MLLGFFVCISVVSGVFSSVRADEYKADVIAEIEDSNFNAGNGTLQKTGGGGGLRPDSDTL